ncbi:MAG: NAD-dependent epimerase/dehydratase family protein [Melioribacteraceae bacterium]|nr:NAD-dependent epimerase/dehydratase family protein [Melioribacteraceae bacterium]MCF8353530.1 NAD-dependent epimerase/dehydratase family protein [Melioribacteraceae bacterium]MCF8392536.1 NAD-dependent epimerase/dehydratase family protein [Melioribacteraceae bacterium]MCF8418449.1 NAD-dependent epimerase/dehydratase family protein [Melioribacteraceae bacterium]
MKVLMIGGTGFISSNIVKKLIEENHEVTLVTRGESEINLFDKGKVKFAYGDRHDKEFLNRIIDTDNFDVLFDMIAYTADESQTIIEVFGGKIPRLIHTSTISVYMVSDVIKNPILEEEDKHPLMKFWDRNPFGMQYGIDKRKCEDVLWKAHNDGKFEVSMIRAPYVCGPYDPMKRDYFWIQRILDGSPLLIPGSGDYASQHIFVEDLAEAFVDLLKYDVTKGKAYNIASEEIFSLNDYLDALCNLLGKNSERVNVDLEAFEKLPFSVSPEGHAFPFNTYRTAIFSTDRAKKDLQFSSTPFEDWMPGTIDWYLNIYKKPSVGYGNRDNEIKFIEKWKKYKREFLKKVIQ